MDPLVREPRRSGQRSTHERGSARRLRGVPGRIRGDFGATHSDKSGKDTLLRTHWNNQATGLVNDEVFELRMEPANWGEITFQ